MTANLLLKDDMAPEPPRCWNRAQVKPVSVRYGIDSRTGEVIAVTLRNDWFTDQCVTWRGVGIGQPTPEYPSGTPYPIAHGWVPYCKTCRWYPAEDQA